MDPFIDYKEFYAREGFDPDKNPVPRPQPCDFVIHYFQSAKNGVFVDVGAYDGITWSNSLPLEKYFGWRGLAIEPIGSMVEVIQKNRSAIIFPGCAWSYEGEIDFQEVEGYAQMLSGVPDAFVKEHSDRIKGDIESHGGRTFIRKVKCAPLSKLLAVLGVKHVDYMSIDVECGELEVLKGFDWENHTVTLISMEANDYNTNEAEKFLLEKGYKKLTKVCNDIFYERVP